MIPRHCEYRLGCRGFDGLHDGDRCLLVLRNGWQGGYDSNYRARPEALQDEAGLLIRGLRARFEEGDSLLISQGFASDTKRSTCGGSNFSCCLAC